MSKRFVFVITDAQHEALEAYRAKHRLRSMGHAARHMIESTVTTGRQVAGPATPVGFTPAENNAFGPVRPKAGSLLKKR